MPNEAAKHLVRHFPTEWRQYKNGTPHTRHGEFDARNATFAPRPPKSRRAAVRILPID